MANLTRHNNRIEDLKKGDTLEIGFKNLTGYENQVVLEVKSRDKVKKGTIDKITFINKNNPQGVRYYAYNRGKGWTFAKGDIAISNVEII
jgi:hypothetical protein